MLTSLAASGDSERAKLATGLLASFDESAEDLPSKPTTRWQDLRKTELRSVFDIVDNPAKLTETDRCAAEKTTGAAQKAGLQPGRVPENHLKTYLFSVWNPDKMADIAKP